METIKIKCPNCGAVLTVLDDPSNVKKKVPCRTCKQTYPFTRFKIIKPVVVEDEDRTSLRIDNDPDDQTCLPDQLKCNAIGYLLDNGTKKIYQLSEGVNLIGRMTVKSAPEATIPITTGDMGFSRKHLNIEVVKESSDTIKYYMYNAANKNLTTVNGISLLGTDKVILHDGDIIRSSATELVFKLR